VGGLTSTAERQSMALIMPSGGNRRRTGGETQGIPRRGWSTATARTKARRSLEKS